MNRTIMEQILTFSSSIGGHPVHPGTRVLVNMWSIHHDPQQWDKPDLFNPGTTATTTTQKYSTLWGAPDHTTFSPSSRSLSWPPRPASHAHLLPAIWGGTSSLRRGIVGQAGALPFPVLAATANEFQAAKRGSPAQPAGAAGRGATAVTV